MAGALPVSPLAPPGFPDLPRIAGARFAAAAAGVRYPDRTDVMLALLDPGTALAGVFTRSATRAAPVLDCEGKIGADLPDGAAILVNSGNANAFTGGRGAAAVEALARGVGAATGLPPAAVFTASTGVIGEPLETARIEAVLSGLAAAVAEDALPACADAIRTTDTFAKGAGTTVALAGGTVSIAGIAKGSGMIAPDMATMLAYVFTDARIARADLQAMLARLADRTFNRITVDGDTSTSDTLMLAATGQVTLGADDLAPFEAALHGVMLDLAHQIVRDGEGATKFVEVRVTGAASDADAARVARSVAQSPLVKTALAGEDPNWGRIVMAVGKSGAAADRDRLSIRFGDLLVAERGWVAQEYTEAAGADYMRRPEIAIGVDLGLGTGQDTVWTCDLTHGYVSINADYRS